MLTHIEEQHWMATLNFSISFSCQFFFQLLAYTQDRLAARKFLHSFLLLNVFSVKSQTEMIEEWS